MKITSAAVGTGWPAAVDMIDTTGWESGYYTIDFILAADKYRDLNVASLVTMSTFSSKLVQWLERVGSKHGWRIGYATNFDVHRNKR